jgi:hypothetical protein
MNSLLSLGSGLLIAAAGLHAPADMPRSEVPSAYYSAIATNVGPLSDELTSDSDGPSSIEPPTRSRDGVGLEGANGTDLHIGLPFPGPHAAIRSDQVLSFDNANGTSTVVASVKPSADPSGLAVSVSVIIESPGAPTEFNFPYEGAATLAAWRDGSVGVLDEAGYVLATIAPAWAVDSRGSAVPTRYEVRGNVLVQIVSPTADAAYPITADPTTTLPGNSMYSKVILDRDPATARTIVRVYPASVNFNHFTGDYIFQRYKDIVPSSYETQTMRDQLVCHARNASTMKSPWNLEGWRPNVGYTATVLALCNP